MKLKTSQNEDFAEQQQLYHPLARFTTTAKKSASLEAWKKWVHGTRRFKIHLQAFRDAKLKLPKAG